MSPFNRKKIERTQKIDSVLVPQFTALQLQYKLKSSFSKNKYCRTLPGTIPKASDTDHGKKKFVHKNGFLSPKPPISSALALLHNYSQTLLQYSSRIGLPSAFSINLFF